MAMASRDVRRQGASRSRSRSRRRSRSRAPDLSRAIQAAAQHPDLLGALTQAVSAAVGVAPPPGHHGYQVAHHLSHLQAPPHALHAPHPHAAHTPHALHALHAPHPHVAHTPHAHALHAVHGHVPHAPLHPPPHAPQAHAAYGYPPGHLAYQAAPRPMYPAPVPTPCYGYPPAMPLPALPHAMPAMPHAYPPYQQLYPLHYAHYPPPGYPPVYRSRARSESEEPKKPQAPPPPQKFDDENWEEPRSRTRLKLISEECPQEFQPRWKYPLSDESRRSFAGYIPKVLSPDLCRSFFTKIKESCDWKQPEGVHGQIPRKTCWMVKTGCKCKYRYGGLEVQADEFPKWMMELMAIVLKPCGLVENDWPNSCNLNLYEDGGMTVGWHSDDERLFQGKFRDCRIISLSLGATRKFELRRNWPEEDEVQLQKVVLSSGDLLTMEGMFQKHFQHRVPREDVKDPRINLTWRWVKKHAPDCPAGRRR